MNELIGTEHGYLTIVEKAPQRITKKGKYTMWKCKCVCGNFREVSHGDLFKNNRLHSCGCKTKETTLNAIDKNTKKRYEQLECTATEHNFYTQYKFSDPVRNRKLDFNLSLKEFIKITNSSCYYCGSAPFNLRFSHSKKESQNLNGVDRVDSSKGYVTDNVVSCCTICNMAKSNSSLENFLNWIEKVYTYQNNK